MTIKRLNNYYLLGGVIESEKEKIMKIEAQLCASPKFDCSGIPKSPSVINHTEAVYLELVTRKNELRTRAMQYEQEKAEIEKYISEIDDMLIRRIVELRVLENRRFKEIADELGGKNTADSIKKMFYRYVVDNSE